MSETAVPSNANYGCTCASTLGPQSCPIHTIGYASFPAPQPEPSAAQVTPDQREGAEPQRDEMDDLGEWLSDHASKEDEDGTLYCDFCDVGREEPKHSPSCIVTLVIEALQVVSRQRDALTALREERDRLKVETLRLRGDIAGAESELREVRRADPVFAHIKEHLVDDLKDLWSGNLFQWVSAPESMKQEAHRVTVDGLDRVLKALESPEARALINARLQSLAPVEAGHREGWQDISTAPKDGTWVLVCRDSGCMRRPVVAQWSDGANGSFNWNDTEYTFAPNCWQALPPPPQEEGQ